MHQYTMHVWQCIVKPERVQDGKKDVRAIWTRARAPPFLESMALVPGGDPAVPLTVSDAARAPLLDLPASGEVERLVLAKRNLFAVTNRRGDIAPAGARDLGLFHLDTRHLSHLELVVAGGPPVCLSAETAD